MAKCRLPCPVTEDMLERLGAMKDVVLQQRTPTRVEQRRAMLVSARQETCIFGRKQYNASAACEVCKPGQGPVIAASRYVTTRKAAGSGCLMCELHVHY